MLLVRTNWLSYISRAEVGFTPFVDLIRRHPDLNWGKRICSPPPYHSAMPPKQYKISEICPVLLHILFLYLLCIYLVFIVYLVYVYAERIGSSFFFIPFFPNLSLFCPKETARLFFSIGFDKLF